MEDLFITCLEDSYVLSIVYEHLEIEHLPDRNTAEVLKAFKDYYRIYKRLPNYSIIQQKLSGKNGALRFWKGAYDNGEAFATDECLGLLEEYLKRVEFQKAFKTAGDVYNREGIESAQQVLYKYVDWARTFSLLESTYTDVIETFTSRHIHNRAKNNARGAIRNITRFYIDELDNLN